jgi:phage terminase large subunit-like protein
MYILPYIHDRMAPHKLLDKIAENHKFTRPKRGVVETSAAFKFIPDYLWKDHRIRYIEDNPRDAKKGEGSRLESMQPLMRAGKIWMQPDMSDMVEQFRMYPRGKDDLIDALEKCVRYRVAPKNDDIVWNHAGINDDPYDPKSGYDPKIHGAFVNKNKTFDPMLA